MQPDKARSNPDGLLLDYARRLQRHRPGRRALWFHLSRLQRQNRDQADLQLAAKQLAPLTQKYHGEVFVLSNGDIVACVKDANLREIETAVFALRFSFARDPLMKRSDEEGTQVFLTSFDMVDQFDTFMARVVAVANGELVDPGAEPPKQPAGLGERVMLSREDLKHPATADALDGHVLTSQGQIAIDRLLNTRKIASFESGRAREWGARSTVLIEAIDAFDTLAMAIARHQLEPEDALGEVERILLPSIGEHFRAKARPNQIVAFRAEALMSPEFLLFDRQLTAAKGGKPRIAFWADEVRDSADTINYLRSFLAPRGYTLGITGLGLEDVQAVAGSIANLRFVEIDHPREIEARDAELIRRLLTRLGPEGVILSEIQTQKALVIARRAGVRLLSGPIVDEAV